MDPAERVLLMEAYRAIEDARLSPASLRGSNVGVFVGMEEGQYGLIAEQGVTTGGAAMISSRLSYFLDLHGPAIATNTACSSGLVALHQATMSLRQGECESALVAGVALSLSPQAWVKMSEAGMISADGQCLSFSSHANGIGIGEAVVVLMLKPLSAALANDDHIYGLIAASGINFDGKTNGVTAPNGRMQAKLIEDIYTSHGIDVMDVSHIVAHGTGTKLGDPVEINGLKDAFGRLSKRQDADGARKPHCAITSCKSNLGHTLAASGLVSLVGLLKGLEHRQIPASLHCEEENEYIARVDSPFYINKSTRDWVEREGRPLMGAVSAFGRSGTNAHVVIEEYRPAMGAARREAGSSQAMKLLVPLSARTSEQLMQKVQDLLDFTVKPVDLVSMAFSLQIGREAMSERVVFIVDSLEELRGKLNAWLRGEPRIEGIYQGSVGPRDDGMSLFSEDEDLKEAIGKWIASNKLSKLERLWVTGMEIDWRGLYEAVEPRPERIALPTYPFARERYWIGVSSGVAPLQEPGKTGELESIEDVIDQLDGGSIEIDQAIAFLKKVV